MIIWGRLIGIFLGYSLFGFLGAIIGFFIGGWFDKGLKINLYQIPRERQASIQAAFFKATFLMMGYIAKADGSVSEAEIQAARDVMARLELDENLKKEAMRLFSEGKNKSFNFNEILTELYQECARYPDLLRFFIEIQLEAALADGSLRKEEKNILLSICHKLQVSPEEFEQLWARQSASQTFHQWFYEQFDPNRAQHWQGGYQQQNRYYQSTQNAQSGQRDYHHQYGRAQAHKPTLADAYAVLGVNSSASVAEIKKAYRKLMSQHHPDKLASRGLPEGMVKLAKEKTQEIRAAYDLIREAKGFK